MNPASETLDELVADLEGCAIRDFFNQNFVDNSSGAWGFHSNNNQMLRADSIPPVASPAGLSPTHDFTEHRFMDDIISSIINTRLSFYVEAYLACLQAVHANPHFGHTGSPLMPSVPPVEVAPVPPGYIMTEPGTSAGIPFVLPVEVAPVHPVPPGYIMTEPGTSAGIHMEVLTELEAENSLGAGDMSTLRRVFSDGDRLKVECLWPNCGRKMMKDNHPRHIRECHQRAKRVKRRGSRA